VPILSYFVIVIGAYLLGSIPTGYLVGRARGIDIRTAGSGNIGATNVLRTLGKPAGAFVLLMDVLKGYVATKWLCVWLLGLFNLPGTEMETCQLVAGICAVLGHNYTCWLKFKGGKGISTSAGVFLALAPLAMGIAAGVWVIAFVLSRYASVASIAAAAALPATIWLMPNSLMLRIVTTVLGLLAIFKHRGNIRRLLNGTEHRIEFRKKEAAQ
jgi:acyl phosphate:glycerol-3-phosphate acyltransferase